jgi:hypothetical protein
MFGGFYDASFVVLIRSSICLEISTTNRDWTVASNENLIKDTNHQRTDIVNAYTARYDPLGRFGSSNSIGVADCGNRGPPT